MEDRKSWLRENWRIGLILVLILGLAAFLRVYFVWNEFAPAGYWTGGGDYSGGSDPFYWERALLYSFQTGKELSWDTAMNYPIGFPDVRPPLFDWFNLLGGYAISPVFPGGPWNAMVWMLNMNAAIFGVLSIIPTYLIGKEAFNRRAGILAALLLAISAASLQRSHATIAVHDSWTLFFVICAFYFYLRALKTLNRRRWVENWFQRKSVGTGLRAFFQENRKSVLYGFLAGLSIAVTALSWQGWAYVPVILVLIFVVELILDRIRNQDAMGVTILFTIILGTPLLVSFPWYSVRNLIHVWWDVPFYLFLVATALGLIFTVTRDYPWTIVIPATFAAGGVGLLVGFTVNPSLLFAFYSGAGYFVKNKVYQTIAEAQEPGMSELILNFGWFTFYIGLAAIFYMVYQLPRRNNAAYTMLVLWTAGALFMALAAARFIFNAAPVMAIATGYALDLILTRFGFEEMRRTYRSLAEGSWRNAVRKSVKPRHVIVAVLIAGLVLLPNVWFAVDAGIPYEQKAAYDRQIHSLLPSFLQGPGYGSVGAGGTFYLGAFGYSLPNQTQYFPAAYQWLSTQDTNLPLADRPSVMAWWDYGFEIAERGGHPVVADPFQNGYAISGQFILAQNESSAIALMALRLVEGDFRANSLTALSPSVSQILSAYGISPAIALFAFKNPGALAPIILNNPSLYGPWDSNLQSVNTPYIYLDQILLGKLSEDRLVSLYAALSAATGTSIGYFMADTRLFPSSATNTGIFYAPAKLSDHRVVSLYNGQVLPYDFFQIFANTNRGNNLPITIVGPTDQVTSTTIQYQPMFYHSMFYRAYVGYSPAVVGSTDKGIPGLDQALSSYLPEPAWNLTHFRVVYRTAYFNPYKDPSNHSSAWRAVNYNEAQTLQDQISAGKLTGVVDMSTLTSIQNGLVILRYYPGAWVNGTVSVGSTPLPGVRITVTDELGTPHYETTTDANGHYSAIAPFGNITITASTGTADNRTLVGSNVLAKTTLPVTEAEAMRVNQDLNRDGILDWLITQDFAIPAESVHGTLYFDLNYDGTYNAGDGVAAGATITLSAAEFNRVATTTAGPTGAYAFTDLPAGAYHVKVTYQGHSLSAPDLQVATGSAVRDIALTFATVHGSTLNAAGRPMGGVDITLADGSNGTTWQTASNETGVYDFPFALAGNFSLTAVSGAQSSIPLSFRVGSVAVDQNLTLTPSGRVEGTTDLFGVPLPYATVRFQEASTDQVIATATSDANGHYSLTLPAGDWNVNGRMYQGTSLYATVGRVAVRQGVTTPFDPNFVDGSRVSGTVKAPGAPSTLRAHIGFLGPNGEWWLRSSLDNSYLAYLPTGSYAVIANTQGEAWVGTANLDPGTTTLDLSLWNATGLSGSVYWDMNGNGRFDTGEGVSGARVSLVDSAGQRNVAVADATGAFTLTLFDNRTYSGSVTADGFESLPVPAATPSEIGPGVTYALTPVNVSLTGTVYLNGTPLLNRALRLEALARGGGARTATGTTFTDGTFSLSLAPGTYDLLVDENVSSTSNAWRYQNLGTDEIVLSVGQGSTAYALTIATRALLKGNVTLAGIAGSATVSFQGPDDRTVATTAAGYSVYLQAGTYSARANRTLSGTDYEVLSNVSVPLGGNLTLALAPATRTSGQITFNGASVGSALALTFVRKEGGSFPVVSAADGTFTAALVAGNYTAELDDTATALVGTITRYYRYTFTGTLTVPPGATGLAYDIAAQRTYDNTTVTGLVSLSGLGVDASLSFLARSGGAFDAQAASGGDGTYSVSLAPGTYAVYATRAVGPSAFLGTLVVPHAAQISYGVPLLPGFVLSGVTTDPSGNRVSATLNLTGAAALVLSTDASGNYESLLPEGSYTITADRTQTEQGLSVDYQGTASFPLDTDTVVNLQLGRVDHHAVALTWDASQNRTINAGGSVTYTVFVHNTGNVQDTYSLSGSTSGWTFTFFPSSVSLDYGTTSNTTAVTVTIQTPASALVNHAPVTITATSTADSNAKGSLEVNVGIVRTRGLTLQVDATSGTFDGRYLNYTLNVRNTGNAPEVVDLSIQNPNDIASSGWSPALGRSNAATTAGLTLTNVTVPANSTTAVKLVLRLSGANGGTTIALQVAAEGAPAVAAQTTYTATLPALTVPSGVGVSGPGTALQLPLNSLLVAVLVGAIAAVAAAIFLTRRGR